jgi:protein-disulfide isomerase
LFKGYAEQLGLDQVAFVQAIENNAYADVINQDMSAGSASGVNATPSFFVNNVLIGQPSFEAIKSEIDKALAK